MPFDVEMQLRRHGAALRALAGEIVRDSWAADDAVQEVWLGALRRPPAHAAAPAGWLVTALRNVVRGLYRKERRHARRERAVAETRDGSVEDHAATLAREEQAQRLLAAVSTLAAPFREAIWQRYFEGRSPREIAARSGVPSATVKSRLQRGLRQLRAKLGNDREPGWCASLAVAFGHATAPPASSCAAWPGVLLMTTWTKAMACTAVIAVAGVLLWSFAGPRGAPPSPPANAAIEAAHASEPAPRDAARSLDEHALRTADAPPAAPTSREVRVTDEAGRAVAGAMVWFVRPGFAYADLAPAQADLYSRATESYLRDFGLARIADEHGSTHIPIAAANQIVVARMGSLYGTNWPRSDGAFQSIVVSAHHTLVVETADSRGTPVPHVKVVGLPIRPNGVADPMAQWTLGTTDDRGRLTHTLAPPTDSDPVAKIRLHAELLDGPHDQQTIDAAAPPTFVRLTLPDTGTVHARIQHADGSVLDARTLESLTAELGVVGARPQVTLFTRAPGASPAVDYARFDADGNACFENVVFDRSLQIRFPGMVVTTRTFAGPTATRRVVTIVHTIAAEHPFVAGKLVGPDGRPVGDATFTLLAPANGELQLAVRGRTDAHGRFVTWLADTCTGQRDVTLQFGMDWGNLGPAREARVRVSGALLGGVDVGTVAMPDPK